MITAKLIPPGMISGVWPEVKDYISGAVDYAHGELTLDNVLADLLSGVARLMVFSEQDQLLAAVVMTVVDYPKKRVVFVTLTGGVEMHRWVTAGIEQVEKIAAELGADAVYIQGRKGWSRTLANSGYSEYSILIGKELRASSIPESGLTSPKIAEAQTV